MLLTTCTRIYTSFNEKFIYTSIHHMKHKSQNMLKILSIKKACKLNGSLEIVTKPYALFSKSSKHGGPPPNFLDSDASIWCVHLAHHAYAIKAPILSRHVRAHTYIKHKWWRFWYPFLLGSMGVSIIRKPNTFICKI